MSLRLESLDPTPAASRPGERWLRVCTHTHMMRGALKPPESHRALIRWCRAMNVDAVGVGSPWTPVNEETYLRYEGVDRELYYSGKMDQRSVREEPEVRGLIAELNKLADGAALFYLDNETPKGRYGHLWWIGWDYDFPAWHDYDQPFDRWMLAEAAPGDFSSEPMPYERRPYLEIVAAQRRAGALGIWAHPTSWWRTEKGAFVTNIASEMPFHLFAEGGLDGMVIMGYRAWQQSYLDLWMRMLDMGYFVPGVAEADKGLSGENDSVPPCLTWFRSGQDRATPEELAREVRAGRVVASNGPFIDVTMDGRPPGSRVASAHGRTHRLAIRASLPDRRPCRVLVYTNGGRLAWDQPVFPGGCLELSARGDGTRTWYVCAVLDDQAPGAFASAPGPASASVPAAAIANPVWLDPDPHYRPGPMTTEVAVTFSPQSPWIGGTVSLETAAGEPLEAWTVKQDTLRFTAPAAGRISLTDGSGRQATRYLVNANPEVQRLQRYLYRGGFTVDHPAAAMGQVPVEAFRLPECRAALEALVMEM